MRDVLLPNKWNKENKTNPPTASGVVRVTEEQKVDSLENSITKVTVELTTVVTPNSKKGHHGFATPKNTPKPKSAASSLFAQRKPPSSAAASTPVSKRNVTPGTSFKTPDLNRSNSVSQKRKIFTTPTTSKHPDTPIPKKTATATNQSLHLSTVETDEECNVAVAVRVRPLNSKEKSEGSTIELGEDRMVTVEALDGSSLSFQYEHCFGPKSNQSEIFRDLVHPLLSKALEGYNACLFSYGQTGSGKTYSMMGSEVADGSKMGRDTGIIPRFGFSLFERILRGKLNASIEVSYFEIYNEKIHDLLSDDPGLRQPKPNLRVREHPQFGPYVENLTVQSISSFDSLQGWLRLGLSRRATAASAMNDKSSRSHCILTITLTQGPKRSKVHLVDLAGSERLVNTCATGDRLREGVRINTSLLTLGKVITALADRTRKTFVPYRDSMLTWILSDSLGGSARTVMLATVSPSKLYVDETLATLRYACQARAIVNKPHIQLQQGATPLMHKQLNEELDRLRVAREVYEKRGAGRELETLQAELCCVRQKLKKLEDERSECEAKVRASESEKSRQLAELARRGIITNNEPGLVMLTSDPSLSLCYALPTEAAPRKVLGSVQPADVILDSPLVAEEHCTLELKSGVFWLIPGDGCDTFVNGTLLTQELPLSNRDRIALGGDVFLLLNQENSDDEECSNASPLVDYEFARMELSLAQNARLNMELTAAKQKALMELESKEMELKQLGASKTAAEAELEIMRADQQRLAAALKAEIEAEKIRMELAMAPLDISIAPSYSSQLIQELKSLEQTQPSLRLHEMNCLVREATQRCRQLGLPYRFSQVQKANIGSCGDQPALQSCVKVRGKGRLSTVCSTEQFMDVLDSIRECDQEDQSAAVQIENLGWTEEENDSLASESSILVDVAGVMRRSTPSPEPSADAEKCFAVLHETVTKLQTAAFKHPNAPTYLKQLSDAVCQLERAYHHPELESFHSEVSSVHSEKIDNETAKSDSWLSEALERLRNTSVASNASSCASTIMHSPPCCSAVPTKSNIRQAALIDSPGKEVRFNFKPLRKRKSADASQQQ